jgi:hypothetical protein
MVTTTSILGLPSTSSGMSSKSLKPGAGSGYQFDTYVGKYLSYGIPTRLYCLKPPEHQSPSFLGSDHVFSWNFLRNAGCSLFTRPQGAMGGNEPGVELIHVAAGGENPRRADRVPT